MAKDKEDKEDPVEGVGHIIASECKEIDLAKNIYKHTMISIKP